MVIVESPITAPPVRQSRLNLTVRGDLGLPLLRNGYALVLNTAITSVVGVVYWIVAAHEYSPRDVGIDSAAISAMMFLAGVSQLNLTSALVRFIPRAGSQTRRLVQRSYLVSVGVAAAVASVFLVGIHAWAPRLQFLGSGPGPAAGFVLATMAWCLFVLQDGVLTGLRRSGFVPVENAAFALAKVALLITLATTLPTHGVFVSWTVALVVALVPTNVLIFGRLIPRHEAASVLSGTDLSMSVVARFVAADYAGFLFWLIPTTLVPVIVTELAGPTANAYFALSWVVAYTLYLFSAGLGSSLVAEAAADPCLLAAYSRKAFSRSLLVVVPAAVLLFVASPYVLGVFGPNYVAGGSTLLRLLALSAVPNCANAIAVSGARAQRRMSAVVGLLGSLCLLVVVLSVVLLRVQGVNGVGTSWLIGQTIVAVVVARPLLRSVWSAPESGARTNVVDRHVGRAARFHLLAIAGRLRAYPDTRRRRVEIARAVPAILRRLAGDGLADARTWTATRLLRTVSDVNVVLVGPAPGTPAAVVKVSRTAAAADSILHQDSVLARLAADRRLDGWSHLLPVTLGAGPIGHHRYRVEALVPGLDTREALGRPELADTVLGMALEAVDELHRRTGGVATLDAPLVGTLVDEHFRTIRRLLVARAGGDPTVAVLDHWWEEVRTLLLGREAWLSWTHGDFYPGNILVGPAGGVTGIIDWEQGHERDLAAIDVLNFLLTAKAIVGQLEFGHVVREALSDEWSLEERRLLAARADREDLPMRALVLLCWARHVAANLEKSPRFAANPVWMRANVESVLLEGAS